MAQPAIVLQLEELIGSRTTVSQGPSGTSTLQDAAISESPSEGNMVSNSATESIEPHPVMAQPATVQVLQQLDASSAQGPSGTSGSSLQDAASESPSEADRMAEIFEEIDTCCGLGKAWGPKMSANYSRYKSYIGPDVSREFCNVMLDGGKDVKVLPWQVECGIAAILHQTKASDLYYRFKFLLGYLEAHQDNKTKPIQTFIDTIQQDVEARQHWPISTGEEFKCVWDMLSHALDSSELEGQANGFQGPIDKIFDLPRSRNVSASFSISLADLESVDLRVKPTSDHFQHLVIEGDAVNILELNYHILERLCIIKNNRAANALEIASLGSEILASLHVLYAKDKFFDKAEALRIFSFMGDSQVYRALAIFFLDQSARSTRPQVLAYRTHALQKLVAKRRSWWPSLVRDLRKQFNAQPLFFYGALLAVFFGVCTVIQTVASVWSLVLALKAA